MTNPCCCSALDTCELASAVEAQILATPLANYTANLSGSATMASITKPDSWEYELCSPDPNYGLICASSGCCSSCHAPPACNYPIDCFLNEYETQRFCANSQDGLSTNRSVHAGHSKTECNCIGPPPSCNPICQGFTACSFSNNGFNTAFAPSCSYGLALNCAAGGTALSTFVLAGNTVTTTVGAVTTETRKRLDLRTWQTVVGGLTVCHMQLRLSFCLTSSQPWTGSCFAPGTVDGFSQNVSFTSIWNGTDNAATFLAKPLNLQGVRWNYGLCPADFDPLPGGGPLNQWNCVTYGNLTATNCGTGCTNCTPATLVRDVTLTTPIFEGYSASCAASLPSGTIDGNFQPWQSVPLQIFIT
jgi:hypothetical protein